MPETKLTLITGPSGSGKTTISHKMANLGLNVVDADTLDGLSGWFNALGEQVTFPDDACKTFLETHKFIWKRSYLEVYLRKQRGLLLLGSARNVFEMADLFDEVIFLQVNPLVLRRRLADASRDNPMGRTEFQRDYCILRAAEYEKLAREIRARFLDGSQSPEEIIREILKRPAIENPQCI